MSFPKKQRKLKAKRGVQIRILYPIDFDICDFDIWDQETLLMGLMKTVFAELARKYPPKLLFRVVATTYLEVFPEIETLKISLKRGDTLQ